MILAATFLGGAKTRLLPMSVPLRFFAAAAIFHVLVFVELLAHASQVTSFQGGLGAPLAAVHLLTLGVLTMTAVGAATQLLPVATRRALVAVWPIKLTFWLLLIGLLLLVGGMHAWHVTALLAGSVISVAGVLLFTGLLADNLRRAGSLPVAAAYGWASLVALIALAALGLLLALDYHGAVLPDHRAAALAHVILGGFGFMGLLAIGFSHVLVPMFALSAAPKQRAGFVEFTLIAGAVALGTIGALANSGAALTIAACIGLVGAGVHLWLMWRVLASGMRKRLGLSFVLVRGAWAMLPATLVVGLAAQYGLAGPNGPTLFAFLLIAGWLLTFLMGILQRILPFLASMHTTRAPGAPPLLMSELSTAAPLNVHALCHGLALAAIATGIAVDNTLSARIGSAFGLAGAIAFVWFTADLMGRVFRSRKS